MEMGNAPCTRCGVPLLHRCPCRQSVHRHSLAGQRWSASWRPTLGSDLLPLRDAVSLVPGPAKRSARGDRPLAAPIHVNMMPDLRRSARRGPPGSPDRSLTREVVERLHRQRSRERPRQGCRRAAPSRWEIERLPNAPARPGSASVSTLAKTMSGCRPAASSKIGANRRKGSRKGSRNSGPPSSRVMADSR